MKAENKKIIMDLLWNELRAYCNKVMVMANFQGLPLSIYDKHEYYQDLCKAIDALENNI